MKTISNKCVSLSVDSRGRLVSLKNLQTGTELIEYGNVAEGWRLVVPSGRHTIDMLYGSQQEPASINVEKTTGGQSLAVVYRGLRAGRRKLRISACFRFELQADEPLIRASAEIVNHGEYEVSEVEFPVIGGLGGFKAAGGGKEIQLMHIHSWRRYGRFAGDLLNNPLPDTGRESDQFVREHETAMWEDENRGRSGFDFYGADEGMYVGYNTDKPQDFVLKAERYPKSVPRGTLHLYPPGTPKWLRLWGVHVARVGPGRSWKSEPVTLRLHKGDWHDAATWYTANCMPRYNYVRPPAWMDDFVGWAEIIGNLYTGEAFHDFKTCTDKAIADKKVTGLDLLFYYGHTNLGAEGADYDQAPSVAMGGEKGFRRMLDRLHANGIRVMLLDHLHRYINRDIPEYKSKKLERMAMLDPAGRPVESRWWKETVLSCKRLEGPTPVWIEICPSCREWQEHYLDHVRAMIARGVDGLELDCFHTGACYSRNHDHKPGEDMLAAKIDFLGRVRAEAKRLNPDFFLVCETMYPPTREVCDAWYSNRYPDENGRIHRFMFPDLRQQTVLVGNYTYDEVNKALMLGIGVETEIWGLRKTTLEGCPELARYIGQVNVLKRKYGDILIRGTFRDTLGADVKAPVGRLTCYSVLDGGAAGKALVLRNPSMVPLSVHARLDDVAGRRLVLTRPGRPEQAIRRQPVRIQLGCYGAAVILAL